MTPAAAGTVATVTTKVWSGPFPQPFEGVTVIVPEFDPTVTLTELVDPVLGVQSAGKVHA
jgi:hypothetical protein